MNIIDGTVRYQLNVITDFYVTEIELIFPELQGCSCLVVRVWQC